VPDVVILGAGLSGLACAVHLTRAGVEVAVHEASDAVGGRARTDVVDGMLLDRGFQVLNTAYPEARRVLDLQALHLQPFVRGALVHLGGRLHRVADPRSAPTWALSSLTAPIGSPKDKAALIALALRPLRLDAPERSTYADLRAHGVSDRAIDRFVRPFLTGVLLDPELATSSRFFSAVWRSFAFGTQALPATGMGAMAQQLADRLPAGTVHLGSRQDGLPSARAVVVATDPATAATLLDLPAPSFGAVTTHYHLADRAPRPEAAIVLDGERTGPVTNTVVLTNAAPTYAPGRVLVSSSVVGTDATEPEVRAHLARLYGVSTASWQYVASYALPQALPSMAPPLGTLRKPVRVRDGVYVCGDHRDTASIQGALVSGRRAATAVLKDLGA
jgi:hypothetical protein